MNRTNSTACGSWRFYSFDSDLSSDYPGRITGLSHFSRDGQPPQEASGWDVLWGTRVECNFITLIRIYKKTTALLMSNLHLHEETELQRPRDVNRFAFLNSWNTEHSLWPCDFEIQLFKLHSRTSLSLLGPKNFSADLLVKQQER